MVPINQGDERDLNIAKKPYRSKTLSLHVEKGTYFHPSLMHHFLLLMHLFCFFAPLVYILPFRFASIFPSSVLILSFPFNFFFFSFIIVFRLKRLNPWGGGGYFPACIVLFIGKETLNFSVKIMRS
jgi:hypothetical protein